MRRLHKDENRYRVMPYANDAFINKCKAENIDPKLMVNLLVIQWTFGDKARSEYVNYQKELQQLEPPKTKDDAVISELLNVDGLFNWD